MAELPPSQPEQQRQFVEAQRLAAAGRCRCRRCPREMDLKDAVTLQFGGAVVLAICPECFLQVDVVLARDVNGIRVEMRPRGIILAV